MNFFTDLDARMAALRGLLGGVESVEQLPEAISVLDDDTVFALIDLAAKAGQLIGQVGLIASGVMDARSTRTHGHSGLAQARGHRNAVSLIQQVTGVSRTEALRQVRVGGALIEADLEVPQVQLPGGGLLAGGQLDGGQPSGSELSGEGPFDGEGLFGSDLVAADQPLATVKLEPWHTPLRVALMRGELTSAQHDAIRQGLGEPPVVAAASLAGVGDTTEAMTVPLIAGTRLPSAAQGEFADAATIAAWSLAAERLTEDAAHLTVEDLAKHARAIRDLLDPEGAQARFNSRYEARSFKMWTDREGLTHGKFVFDDESAAWIQSILSTALRPRRGGPRFVDPNEQAAAKQLREDPRSNEQLAHDLLLDVWKSGSVADAAVVFGTRQASIRLVQVVDRDEYLLGRVAPVTRLLDGGVTLPESVAAKQRCNTGVHPVTVDTLGNPLDVGREQRLYTSKQRIALAVRDGGCRWNGCDRPASYCEAHHIDHWSADSGRTDIDRGILLCSFHHMQLHNNGWKITREADGPFMLHPPPDASPPYALPPPYNPPPSSSPPTKRQQATPVELRPPLPLSYAWQLAKPPEKRFRPAA